MDAAIDLRVIEEGLVGLTADGDRVKVRITLEEMRTHRQLETINHEYITPGTTITRLSIQADVTAKGYRHAYSAGQCREALLEVVTPKNRWVTASLQDLYHLWNRYHLNDMKAACVHMDVPTLVTEELGLGPHILTDSRNRCCVSGYRYGSAWLYEPLPDAVIAKVRHFQGLIRDAA